MKKIFLMILVLFGTSTFAGDAAGHGGGTLARLLSYARNEISNLLPLIPPRAVDFKSAALSAWYAKSYGKMVEEIDSLKFQITSGVLRDSSFSYETWIRVRHSREFVIEYNSDVDKFTRLVGVIDEQYRHSQRSEAVPSISDVTEYLLHEIGHRYGLGEEDAWAFAQTLAPKFKFNRPLKPKFCEVTHFGQTGDGLNPTKITVTKNYHSQRMGGFYLDYRLWEHSRMFEFTVFDSIRSNREFHLLVSADARVSGFGGGLQTGWSIGCED